MKTIRIRKANAEYRRQPTTERLFASPPPFVHRYRYRFPYHMSHRNEARLGEWMYLCEGKQVEGLGSVRLISIGRVILLADPTH